MLVEFATSPTFTALVNMSGIIFGVAGIVLGFWAYVRGKERYTLGYSVVERTLLHPSSDKPFDIDLPLKSGGSIVGRVTRTYFLIKNTGNRLLERSALVETPAIRLREASFLRVSAEACDDAASQISLELPSNGAVEFDFAFLRAGDAFVIRVDHTGAEGVAFIDCRTKANGPIGYSRVAPHPISIVLAVIAVTVVAAFVSFFVAATPTDWEALKNGRNLFGTFMANVLVGGTTAFCLFFLTIGGFDLSRYLLRRRGFLSEKPAHSRWNAIMLDYQRRYT